MRIGSLFTGYGGLDLGVQQVIGGTVAWHSDVDPAAAALLVHHWPDVPNLGDITAVEWDQVEPVDVLTGGFPCQDVSTAGRRAGLTPGTRSGLWAHMARAIHMMRPRYVVAENVRGLLSASAASQLESCTWCLGNERGHVLRALGAVLGDLAVLGYDARWCGLRAADVGAPHGRFRVFILAEDTHRAAGGQRRQSAPGQAEKRGARADTCGRGRAPVAHANVQHERPFAARDQREQPETPARNRHIAAADTQGAGRHQGRPKPSGVVGRPDAVFSGSGHVAEWGAYADAIRRWERALGRCAPSPVQVGIRGGQQLAPPFVEWMMGLDAGHVCGVPDLTRNQQLKLLGNGVVPQQAAEALARMLA